MSKEVAKKETQVPAEYAGYEEYAGAGFENQTSADYAIPFLQILQALSPQIEADETGNLRQGMIVNTVTGETFDGKKGLTFIPATTEHLYVEWKPDRGGFVGIHQIDSDIVRDCVETQEFGEYKTPEGNDLVETFYVYGIAIADDNIPQEAVLAFSSTKIKKYKGWMTKAKSIQIQLGNGRRIPAPLFAHKYRLKTESEKNTKGSFYNWSAITFDGDNALAARLLPNDELFQAAANIKSLIESGKARAAHESQVAGDGGESSGDGGGSQSSSGGKPVF